MKLDNLKDLEKLIKLCQKTGVSSIKVDGVELTIPLRDTKSRHVTQHVTQQFNGTFDPGPIAAPEIFESSDELTDEQKLFYSAIPHGDQQ